jgi:2-dehydropantoate 2-reductase
MHYLIFGAGAVGSFLGARLVLSGQQTTFLARPDTASSWKAKGLTLVGEHHEKTLLNPNVIDDLSQNLIESAPDIILLTVKTYDVEVAAEQIRISFPAPIPIVCFTNGVGCEALLSALLEDFPIIPATLTTAVQRTQDNIVRVERERGLGFASSHPILTTIIADFRQAGITVRRYHDANRMKWSKLMTNIVGNATSAILDWLPRQIFQHPYVYRVELEALRETVRVMRKMGIRPQNLPGVPVSVLSHAIFLPPRMTQTILGRIVSKGRGKKLPSFHFDIGRGRSEIHYLNGAVVRAGDQIGLPTPANRFLLDTMTAIVENAAARESFRNQPEEFLKSAIDAGFPGIRGYNP